MAKKSTIRRVVIKHDDVLAFDAWLATEDGQRCMTPGAYGDYLRNRLIAAFYAGAEHGRRCPNPRNGRVAKVVTLPR